MKINFKKWGPVLSNAHKRLRRKLECRYLDRYTMRIRKNARIHFEHLVIA